jgi:AraC-like DNA-binding protein
MVEVKSWPVSPKAKDIILQMVSFKFTKEDGTTLPFFADGFPGLIYFQSSGKVTVSAGGISKVMDPLFVYGQTLEPISIHFESSFRMYMLQLYPSVIESAFGIRIGELTNSCWTIPKSQWGDLLKEFQTERNGEISSVLSILLNMVTERSKEYRPDRMLHECIDAILLNKGNLEIKDISKRIGISDRTLQRRFQSYVGLTPKQFAKIIRFQSSLSMLNQSKKTQLTDIAYDTGYFDQSHFIRQFKVFTKQKPFTFREKNESLSPLSNF